jgi:hypothetical protein
MSSLCNVSLIDSHSLIITVMFQLDEFVWGYDKNTSSLVIDVHLEKSICVIQNN